MTRTAKRTLALIAGVVAVVALMYALPTPKHEEKTPPNDDPWVMVNYDRQEPYGTYLGSGLISTRIKGDGVGSQDGRPLNCFMAGLYDKEKLIPTPTWSDFRIYVGDTELRIDEQEDYRQRLVMKHGVLVTTATWRAGRRTLSGSVEVVVSRAQPNVGLVMAVLTPNFDGQIRIASPVGNIAGDLVSARSGRWWSEAEGSDGSSMMSGALITRHSRIPLAVAKTLRTHAGTSGVAPRLVVPTDRPDPELRLEVKRDDRFMVLSYSALATGPNVVAAQQKAEDELESAAAAAQGFVRRHKAEWENIWRADIVIDGPPKEQQVLRSCRFYLLQSVRPGSRWSIPPMGLSDGAFSGHVFWDADTWMFPALILLNPELARAIVDYRFHTLPGALANAAESGMRGAEYAWESGYTGREDTPEGLVYRHERHINGDVALAQWQYYLATGDLQWLRERGYPVISATADYWVSRSTFNQKRDRWEIHRVVPPDENADLVNNSAYTNCIAQMNLRIAQRAAVLLGVRANPRWATVADGMYIPIDGNVRRFVAFDGYAGLKAKQADCELLIYPLQYKLPGQDMTDIYKNTFEYYAPRAMENGPAMTSSAHSVIAARLGDREQAYTDFGKSYKPFVRGPFNYFNEKRSRTVENMCFLTGAAGPMQAALFGLAGIRIEYFPEAGQAVELSYKPCLPKQWKSLRVNGLTWRGKRFDLIVDPDSTARLLPHGSGSSQERS